MTGIAFEWIAPTKCVEGSPSSFDGRHAHRGNYSCRLGRSVRILRHRAPYIVAAVLAHAVVACSYRSFARTGVMQHEKSESPSKDSDLTTLPVRIDPAHPAWDALTKLVAPGAIAISAASYLSGFIYRFALFRAFGFGPNVIDYSVQDTITLGYIPLALGVIALAGTAGLAMFIGYVLSRLIRRSRRLLSIVRVAAKKSFKAVFLVNVAYMISVLMLLGVLTGSAFAAFDISNISRQVSYDCMRRCMYYRLEGGEINAILLGQSKDFTVLVGRSSAYLIPTRKIRSTAPSQRSRRWVSNI